MNFDRLINPPLVIDPTGRPIGRCDLCSQDFFALPISGDHWPHNAAPRGYQSPSSPALDEDDEEIIPTCGGMIRRLSTEQRANEELDIQL